MGKRYYCDYCDRHFVDDLGARKKHLLGVNHVRLRKEYYDQFKDPQTRYKEEISKPTCKRFQRFGECPFGSNCRYSHYSHEDLEVLKYHVEVEQQQVEYRKTCMSNIEGPTLSSWLEKRHQRELSLEEMDQTNSATVWNVPSSLKGRVDLPQSLKPFKIEDFTHSDFETWG